MKHDPTTSFFQGTPYDIQHTKGNPYETAVDGIVCDLAVNPHILAALKPNCAELERARREARVL